MKTRKLLSLLLTVLLLCSLLTACGGSSKSPVTQESPAAAAPREEAAMDSMVMLEEGEYEAVAGNSLTTGESGSTSAAVPENRKWIITIHMNAETEDLDGLLSALDADIAALTGFVEDQHIYNGSAYASRRYRSASLTIRIPAEDVDKFTQRVAGLSNVVSSEKNLEDITLTYVSTESRKQALETEEARLLELMEQAETMADLLEIEARLTDVRYELESAASRLRTYDNQVNYATVYLSIEEVQEYTPVKDPTVWERIRDGFKGSVKGLGESLVDIAVWLIVASPYLLVYGGIAAVVLVILKGRKKSGSRKLFRKKKAEKPNEEA